MGNNDSSFTWRKIPVYNVYGIRIYFENSWSVCPDIWIRNETKWWDNLFDAGRDQHQPYFSRRSRNPEIRIEIMWPRDTLWHPYVTLSLEICHVTSLFVKYSGISCSNIKIGGFWQKPFWYIFGSRNKWRFGFGSNVVWVRPKHFRFCSWETSDWALEKTIKLKFKYIQIPLMRDHKMFVKWMMALAPGSLPCEASSAQSPATLQPPKHPSLTLIARNGHPSDHFYLTDSIRA